jgi:hypothetical protein
LWEAISQTYLEGVPVQLSSGYVQEAATISSVATALIAGFSLKVGQNLSTVKTPKFTSIKTPPNQSAAVTVALGTPQSDAQAHLVEANDDNVFEGTIGNSSDGTLATIAATDLGANFGLTKDGTNSYWYVDKNITALASGSCVKVVELVDVVGTLNGKVRFVVISTAQQLQSQPA